MTDRSSYHSLIDKLNGFIRKYYINQLLRGSIYFVAIGLGLFLCAILLEHFGQFNSNIRTVLFYAFLVSNLLVFSKYIVLPLSQLFAIRKQISHEQAAQIIGRHFSEVSDKLFNILQLRGGSNVSSELVEASINQKAKELHPIPFVAAINLKDNKKYLKYALPPIALFLFILLFSPNIISESTNRLVAHEVEFIPEAPFRFVIENEKLEAIKHEDYTLKVRLEGDEIPEQLSIEVNEQSIWMKKTGERSFQYSFKNLQEDQFFNLKGLEFLSKNYRLAVLPKPKIIGLRALLNYPKYLNLKDKTIDNTGDISIPEGTHIKWTLKTQDADNLSFIIKDSLVDLVRNSENLFSYSDYFYASQSYHVLSKNEFVPVADTLRYSILVTKDKRPSIELDVERDSSRLNLLYFNGLIKDDYGFSRLEFHHQVIRANGESEKPQREFIPINTQLPLTDYYHAWNTEGFQLKPGDQVDYYFTVWDNDGVNGSKPASTAKLVFRAPSLKELSEKESQSNEKIKAELENNIDLAKEIRDDLERLKAKMIDKKNIGYQEKKLLEDVLKKQKKIQNSIQKLNKENEQKDKLQKQYSEIDEELIQKQEQLQDLFEKVMTEEMKQMLAEIEKMMDELKKEDIQKALEKMELNNEELEKELDRNLELFKQLELEKEVAETKKALDELKEKQEDLREKTENKEESPEELKQQQEELKEDFEALEKKLEDIKEKNKELEQPNKMPQTDALEEEIKKDMQESADELGKKNSKKASGKQKEAGDKMQEMSDQLSDLQMQMQSGASAENMEDLRFLLENLIQLSFDQESVMENLKETNINDPKYFTYAQRQKKLKDDAKIIEDSLFALSKRIIQLEATVNREVGAINHNMLKAIEELGERRTEQANSRQQFAMTSINNLALLLDEALQNMQSQLNMQSKGNCKKPGQGSPKPGSGNSMSKLQQQLNQQLEQLKKAMEKGKMPNGSKPGAKPGSQGMGGMSKQLAKTAAKQAAIREALENMQNQMQKEGNQDGLGGMKKLGEMMEETETDIVNKRITNETILRQQEILTRLLQSEKAQREREKEEQREATEFTDQIDRNPNEFLEYNRRKEKEIELLRTLPPTFNQFYKQKVSEYFKNL